MLTALVFIIILGLLIFVHELGHFLVARKNGIRAYEFGFGFPPRIVGIQPLKGKKLVKVAESEEITDEITELKMADGTEVIKEKIVDKITEIDTVEKEIKWRWIWGKRNSEKELKEIPGLKEDTIYSINWIPLGGFVKIKGEDGSHDKDPDSFSSRNAWTRIKVLAAGIIMNFLLAWFLLAVVFVIGAPQAVDDTAKSFRDSKIQISQIIPESPADAMGIQPGDEIIGCAMPDSRCQKTFSEIAQVQEFINSYKGKEIALEIKRGKEILELKGTPRVEYPKEQGALGISLVHTAIVRYPWYEAIVKGLTTTFDIIALMFETLANILKGLVVGQKMSVDVAGPVGIAYLTKQVTDLGLVYILQFAALLSINLGIINGLPFPALDGGRIIFILIEKIKGSPVKRNTEQLVHTIGFILLILLMVVVTLRDVIRFDVIEKIGNMF
jgi:regulator of sigma E protease